MIAGTLEIQMMAQMARLSSDMKKAQGIVGGAMKNIEGAVAGATRALGALGIGVGFGALSAGLVSVVKESIAAASALDDLAEMTGASVENLSKLSQQAFISGTDMGTVEQALVRLGKSLNGTDEESKKAERALSALGLTAQQLRTMDTAEALKVVADRMNQFGDSSGKTALAMDLFGKSGAQVLPFLKDLANDAQLASRVTAEQAAKAEELEKAFRRLGNEARMLGQALSLDLVPPVLRFIQAVNDASRLNLDFGTKAMFANPFTSVNEALTKTRDELDKAIKKKNEFFSRTGVNTQSQLDDIEKLQKRLEFFKGIQARDALSGAGGDTRGEQQRFGLGGAKAALNYASATEKASKSVQESAARFEDYEMRVAAAVASAIHSSDIVKAQELARAIEHLDKLFFDAGLDAEIYEAAMRKLTGATDNSKEIAKAAAEEQRKLQQIMDEGKRVFDATRTPVENFNIELENLKRLLDANAISWDTYIRAVQQAQDKLEDLSKNGKKELDDMGEFAREAARGIQRSFSDGLFDIMQGKFDNMGQRFKAMLDRMVADALAAQLARAVFGDMDKTGNIGGLAGDALKFFGFGGGGGGIGYGEAGTAAATAMVPAIGGGFVPALAEGGDFFGGRPILVGEEGPELMMPKASGTVIPNDQLGGNVTNNNVRVVVNVPPSVNRDTADQMAKSVGRSVQRAVSRG